MKISGELGTVQYSIMSNILSPVLKVLADIILYLGEPSYRSNILKCVRASIKKSIDLGARRLVLITHSLGSVICVDALRSYRTNEKIYLTLVTSGSPLRRLFHRFFAHEYASPVVLLSGLSARYPGFNWINVFRPNDPIGASLSLSSSHDLSTEQSAIGWAKAHIDYWSDQKVHEVVWRGLSRCPKQTANIHGQSALAPIRLVSPVDAPGGLWIRFVVLAFITISGASYFWNNTIKALYTESDQMQALQMEAEETTGRLYIYNEMVRGGDRGFINVAVPRYTVEYSDSSAKYTLQGPPNTLCDSRKLRDLYKKKIDPKYHVMHPDRKHKAIVVEVGLLYLKNQPTVYTIKGCERYSVPISYWVLSYLLLLASIPLIVLLAYGVIRFILWDILAAFAGLTNEQYDTVNTRARISSSDRSSFLILLLLPVTLFSTVWTWWVYIVIL